MLLNPECVCTCDRPKTREAAHCVVCADRTSGVRRGTKPKCSDDRIVDIVTLGCDSVDRLLTVLGYQPGSKSSFIKRLKRLHDESRILLVKDHSRIPPRYCPRYWVFPGQEIKNG